MPINEADTCRTYVIPKLYRVGWKDKPISRLPSGRIARKAADLFRDFFNIGALLVPSERDHAQPTGRR